MNSIDEKYERLQTILREMGSVVIGYSGGVDSTFLAKVSTDVLGDKALSVAAISDSFPEHERQEAITFAEKLGLHFTTVTTNEMSNPNFRKNESDRCYHCKQELVTRLFHIAKEQGFNSVAIGTNIDDLGDHRPGQQAAKEAGTRSPLIEAELTKDDIRVLSKRLNLPTHNKPSFACLSSRVPYGEEITLEKLRMVEQAESFLRQMNLTQFRVRHHQNLARIEVMPEEMRILFDHREEITARFREIGYTYVSMDLTGYRTGSMNETLYQVGIPANVDH